MSLTDQQLASLKQSLIRLAQDLQQLLEDTESGAQPVKLKDNQGRLSRMDEMHNQSILLANRNLTKNRLTKVRAAQHRIEEGYYGECDDCGGMIALSRLEAYPEANLCIDCQAKAEAE